MDEPDTEHYLGSAAELLDQARDAYERGDLLDALERTSKARAQAGRASDRILAEEIGEA